MKPAVKRQGDVRRYYAALSKLLKGDASEKEAEKIELLMNMEGITVSDRKVAVKALERAQQTGGPAAALELEDGRIITGKTSTCSVRALHPSCKRTEGTCRHRPQCPYHLSGSN